MTRLVNVVKRRCGVLRHMVGGEPVGGWLDGIDPQIYSQPVRSVRGWWSQNEGRFMGHRTRLCVPRVRRTLARSQMMQ